MQGLEDSGACVLMAVPGSSDDAPPASTYGHLKSRTHHCWGRGEGGTELKYSIRGGRGSGLVAVRARPSVQEVGIELMASSQQPKNQASLVCMGAGEGSWAGTKGDLGASVQA